MLIVDIDNDGFAEILVANQDSGEGNITILQYNGSTLIKSWPSLHCITISIVPVILGEETSSSFSLINVEPLYWRISSISFAKTSYNETGFVG